MSTPAENPLAWITASFQSTPITALLGATLVSYDSETGQIVTEYDGKPEFRNLIGTIQGGILTAMLDNAMSFAALARLGEGFRVPSLEVKTSYIAPAFPGRIVGEAEVVRAGRSIVFTQGQLFDAEGTLIATATATAMVRKRAEA